MYHKLADFIKDKHNIQIIQAENPDVDSLGSAVALDYFLGDLPEPIETSLYCPVDIPKYLRYFEDWSRVSSEFDYRADAYIIVDTAATILLSKLLDDPAIRNRLYDAPVLVIDHHESEDDLDFPHEAIIEPLPACCSLILQIAKSLNWHISRPIAENLYMGISSDTLGFTASSVSADTFRDAALLIDAGANVSELEERRREYMKKSPRILDYKADLIKRVEYSLDGTLATVHITWDEIHEYSNEYNPNVLIIEELRLVEGVEVAVAIKTYPDGKVTGKVRSASSAPVADQIAEYFGGGGHPHAAGFRTYDTSYEAVVQDLINILPGMLAAARAAQPPSSPSSQPDQSFSSSSPSVSSRPANSISFPASFFGGQSNDH